MRYVEVKYTRVEEELMRLRIQRMAIRERREHGIAGDPEEYMPVCWHTPLPLNSVENLEKRQNWVMQAWRSFLDFNEKQIPPPLKMFLQTHLPLPIHES